jgi:hypothetical protein
MSSSWITGEGTALQIATAVFYLVAAYLAALDKRYVPISLGFAWLAIDESLMFHECFKIALADRGFGGYGDYLLIFYVALGVLALPWLWQAVRKSTTSLGLIAMGTVLVAIAVGNDVFGLIGGSNGEWIEESCEASLAASAAALFFLVTRNASIRRKEATAFVTVILAVSIFALIVVYMRPAYCGRIHGLRNLKFFGPLPYTSR